mmetsp:Transcript_34607/g.77651  ORF Transcript_34607/g.77651 Transcript_34607/m.77651 type:complete len:644 (+) Transcript_34607:55-1986(+)
MRWRISRCMIAVAALHTVSALNIVSQRPPARRSRTAPSIHIGPAELEDFMRSSNLSQVVEEFRELKGGQSREASGLAGIVNMTIIVDHASPAEAEMAYKEACLEGKMQVVRDDQQRKALVVVQCFPPLLKNAGGVSKRYLTLCRALIDGLGWKVTLVTPVDVKRSKEDDVARWIQEGSMQHLPARGARICSSTDGVAVFLDLMSYVNAGLLLNELCWKRGYSCVFMDDVPWRLELLLLARAMGVPAVVSTHTDITHMKSYKGVVKVVWYVHMFAARLAAVHATVSRVFGNKMAQKYRIPVGAVWPPILWSSEFQGDPQEWQQLAKQQRDSWLQQLESQGCLKPRALMLFAGRWSAEKRIHLLWDALPADCALVIVGDGTSDYADKVAQAGALAGRRNVLPLRKMLSARDLRISYAASDLFLSASNFETLGNTIVEAWCSGTPSAVQPAQGHLEFIKDGVNSWFVDYDDGAQAQAKLADIISKLIAGRGPNSVLPEFASMGKRFRAADFAREFQDAVLSQALEVGQKQARRCRSLLLAPIEIFKRILAFIVCLLTWFTLRLATRITFMTGKDPEIEVLGPLGGAVDDHPIASVWTFPCMRLFWGEREEKKETAGGKEDRKSPHSGDGTDFESHFGPAKKRSRKK